MWKYLLSCILFLFSLQMHAQLGKLFESGTSLFNKNDATSAITKDIAFLCDPGFKGRPCGSEQEEQIASYIAKRFAQERFIPYSGTYFHYFSAKGSKESLNGSFVKIENQTLQLNRDVIIPEFSGTGTLNTLALPALREMNNLWCIPFSEIGVELKNPNTGGKQKIYETARTAEKNGASGLILYNDQGIVDDFQDDPQFDFARLKIPVVLLNHKASENYIIRNPKKDFIDFSLQIKPAHESAITEGRSRNIIAYWGNRAKKTIVIGANYDGIGLDENKNIVPGADYNASAVSGLFQIAKYIKEQNLNAYNYILIAYSGAEEGLLGARQLVHQSKLDSSNTYCVIDMDAIGQLNAQYEIEIRGAGSSENWNAILDPIAQGYTLTYKPNLGNGDYLPFYQKKIPFLHISTGHQTYHNTSGDSRDKLNIDGIITVCQFVDRLLFHLEKMPKLPFNQLNSDISYRKINLKVSLGITLDDEYDGRGVRINEISPSQPGAQAGMLPGDVIIRIGPYDIRNIKDYFQEMQKIPEGGFREFMILRNGSSKSLTVKF